MNRRPMDRREPGCSTLLSQRCSSFVFLLLLWQTMSGFYVLVHRNLIDAYTFMCALSRWAPEHTNKNPMLAF